MKILKYFGVMVAIATLAVGCKEATLDKWDSPATVYFAFGNYDGQDGRPKAEVSSKTFISMKLAGVNVPDSIIAIDVAIVGSPVSYDRKVGIAAVPVNPDTADSLINSRNGVDYELLHNESVIPAGKTTGKVYVRLITTDSLTNSKATGLNMKLKLVPNENFNTDYSDIMDTSAPKDPETGKFLLDPRIYSIAFTNDSERSPVWRVAVIEGVFSAWSNGKVLFMCDVFGQDYNDYYPTDTSTNGLNAAVDKLFPGMRGMSGSAAYLFRYQANMACEMYKLEHGSYPVDETGNAIKFGTNYDFR